MSRNLDAPDTRTCKRIVSSRKPTGAEKDEKPQEPHRAVKLTRSGFSRFNESAAC